MGERLPALASLLAVMLEDIAGVTKLYYRFCGSWRGRGDAWRYSNIKAIYSFCIPLRNIKKINKGISMSFNEKIIKARAKELGLTEKEVREAGKRIANFIKKEAERTEGEITPIIVLKSFFILNEVKNKRYNKKAKELALKEAKIKNKREIIEKYADKIIDLNILRGWGSRKIAKYLKEKHNVDISHTTILKFLKEYKQQKK